MKRIYLDYAAATPLDPRVKKAMEPYASEIYGNPGSLHEQGMKAKQAIDNARKKVADILHCKTAEIIFTAGGTESINLALIGYVKANKEKGNHIITTKIEHPAVLKTCQMLEREEGCKVSYLDVEKDGRLDIKKLENAITPQTVLISVAYANNEIGVIQDIPAIGEIAQQKKIIFHTDASQAPEYLDLNVETLKVDLMTLNGSKIYGPKGTGILYKKQTVKVKPLIYGGGQEFNLRSGTENVAGIMGFAEALQIAQKERIQESKRVQTLRDELIEELEKIPRTTLNGSQNHRLPNNINISFDKVEGEALVLILNEEGIEVATGAACSSKEHSPSHVLLALGDKKKATGSLRITLGRYTTKEKIREVSAIIMKTVEQLRKI